MKKLFVVVSEIIIGDVREVSVLTGLAGSPTEAAAESAHTLAMASPHATLRVLSIQPIPDDLVREASWHLLPPGARPPADGRPEPCAAPVGNGVPRARQDLLEAMSEVEAAAAGLEQAEDEEEAALARLDVAIRRAYPGARDGQRVRIAGKLYRFVEYDTGRLTLDEVEESVVG